MTSVTDRNGNATTCAYNGQDQLTTVIDPVGKVTTLAYGGGGKLATVTDPAGRVTTFVHDAAGDLVQIIDPDLSERDRAARRNAQASLENILRALNLRGASRRPSL